MDTEREAIADVLKSAADQLRALLALPDERPGAWESEHVIALEDELRAVLDALEGDDQEATDNDR